MDKDWAGWILAFCYFVLRSPNPLISKSRFSKIWWDNFTCLCSLFIAHWAPICGQQVIKQEKPCHSVTECSTPSTNKDLYQQIILNLFSQNDASTPHLLLAL